MNAVQEPTARAEMVVHHMPDGHSHKELIGFDAHQSVTFVAEGLKADTRACLLLRSKTPIKIKHVDHKIHEHHHHPPVA